MGCCKWTILSTLPQIPLESSELFKSLQRAKTSTAGIEFQQAQTVM